MSPGIIASGPDGSAFFCGSTHRLDVWGCDPALRIENSAWLLSFQPTPAPPDLASLPPPAIRSSIGRISVA